MIQIMKLFAAINVIAFFAFGELPKGYRQYKQFQLEGSENRLELLVDKKISEKVLKQLGSRPQKGVYLNGIVRLVSPKKELGRIELKKAIVDIEPLAFWPDKKSVFLVTEDWTESFGSYNGPITYLIQVGAENLSFVESTLVGDSKSEKIELMRSLKTDWKIIKSKKNAFPEILLVSCRPDPKNKDGDFLVNYGRFNTDGQKWFEKRRSISDFWENNGNFPLESLFPEPN